MANKVERFTNHARCILSLSQVAAQEFGHVWIEPEHLLIGMSRAEGTTAFFVLSDADIIAEKLLPYFRNRIAQSKKIPEYSVMGLGDETAQLLNLSIEIADERELLYIDPSVLLLSLMQLRHRGIEAALAHFGIEAETIIEMAAGYLGEEQQEPSEKPSLMNNIVQSFQEFFRKKKNNE